MDGLKIIPQVFFDLIGRVIPGGVFIIAYLLLFDKTWGQMISQIFGKSNSKDDVTALTILIFIGASYTVGQLLSPAAKFIQRLGEKDIFKPEPSEKGAYDFLRMHHPDAGALCAKIRAEFTMFNGLVVVFALSTIYYPFRETCDLRIFFILIILTLTQAVRGKNTRDTFQKTVKKFYKAAKEEDETEEPK